MRPLSPNCSECKNPAVVTWIGFIRGEEEPVRIRYCEDCYMTKKKPKKLTQMQQNESGDQIRAKFDRDMNTPSPNPRYGGLAPTQVLQRSAKRKAKKAKSDSEAERELQLST